MTYWKTIEINSLAELEQQLYSYGPGWIFRGQSSASWELESTLERMLHTRKADPEIAGRCEEYSLQEFQSKACQFMPDQMQPSSKLGWLTFMQYHGVPTRLLSFTDSPLYALFFAFDGVPPVQSEPRAVWAVNQKLIVKTAVAYLQQQFKDFTYDYLQVQFAQNDLFSSLIVPKNPDILWVTGAHFFSLELERQKCLFLLSGNTGRRISDFLGSFVPSGSVNKTVIPASLRSEALHLLSNMGIDSSRLYGDVNDTAVDSLAKEVRLLIQSQVI